jgi:hypothetical protein
MTCSTLARRTAMAWGVATSGLCMASITPSCFQRLKRSRWLNLIRRKAICWLGAQNRAGRPTSGRAQARFRLGGEAWLSSTGGLPGVSPRGISEPVNKGMISSTGLGMLKR